MRGEREKERDEGISRKSRHICVWIVAASISRRIGNITEVMIGFSCGWQWYFVKKKNNNKMDNKNRYQRPLLISYFQGMGNVHEMKGRDLYSQP